MSAAPSFDLSSLDKAVLTYWRWYTNDIGDNGNNDKWIVSVSNNGGATWQDLENNSISNACWIKQRFVINDYLNLLSDILFQFVEFAIHTLYIVMTQTKQST